jgi:hypothetical protein
MTKTAPLRLRQAVHPRLLCLAPMFLAKEQSRGAWGFGQYTSVFPTAQDLYWYGWALHGGLDDKRLDTGSGRQTEAPHEKLCPRFCAMASSPWKIVLSIRADVVVRIRSVLAKFTAPSPPMQPSVPLLQPVGKTATLTEAVIV